MNKVLNNSMDFFGGRFISKSAPILEAINVNIEDEERKMLSEVFEQFLLFDEVIIKTGNINTPILILLKELGINTTEELIEKGIIKFFQWTPYLLTKTGVQIDGPIIREYGKDNEKDIYDDSKILGTDPILVSNMAKEHFDTEKILDNVLEKIDLNGDRKRIFKRIVLEKYLVPNINDAKLAKEFVIDAYKKNYFEKTGLDNKKDIMMLGTIERQKLLDFAYDLFETKIMVENDIKYYNDYNFLAPVRSSLFGIANALKIRNDIEKIYEIENIADLKKYFIQEKLDFKKVFEIRELPNAKYFRKWINERSESEDGKEITSEYMNEISGKNDFFKTKGGKLLKSLGIFGIGAGFGAAISGINGTFTGGLIAKATDLGIGLFDSFWLENILAGKNPKMFIDNLKDYFENQKNQKFE